MKRVAAFMALAFLLIGLAGSARAEKIEDNSFLIEEAYNQEPGVVQHIQNFFYVYRAEDSDVEDNWVYSFTQEWPIVSQKHQFSYTIPVAKPNGPDEFTGVGDVLLNYRYQLLMTDTVALAPRVSLVLPTGSVDRGLGTGEVGFQTNLPLSVTLNDQFVMHWNMGATYTPNVEAHHSVPYYSSVEGGQVNLTSFNYGVSLVWLAQENFNVLVEAVGTSNETVYLHDFVTREDTFFFSPGFRFAINLNNDLQIVPGLAAPIGIGPSRKEYALFAYLSFEHPFMKAAEPAAGSGSPQY